MKLVTITKGYKIEHLTKEQEKRILDNDITEEELFKMGAKEVCYEAVIDDG